MALLKLGQFFTILLIAATVNSSWLSKKQVLAGQVVDYNLSGLKRRLLPQLNDLWTCQRPCTTKDDCNDCWVCCYCSAIIDIYGETSIHCSNLDIKP
uniref:Fruit-specific protein-like n=2 Tax=Nicotiana TaxID=4085 RepID=A0A1S3XS25_TOBAC|nr:PREDICTED: fruit-specific protein-like [Nicotiana sylvestris]XP_016442748.1 PREDICTED: fruit-specific protein-like [Nicotiana tabacum]